MKKVLSLIALSLVLVMGLVMFASCGAKKVPAGSYEAELELFGQSARVTYTFSGNKVEAEKKVTLFGTVNTETANGTYEIVENSDGTMEITFDFEEESDTFKDKTFTYKETESSVELGGVKYSKIEKK